MSDVTEKEVIDHDAAEAAIQRFSFTAPKIYDGPGCTYNRLTTPSG